VTPSDPRFKATLAAWAKIGQRLLRGALVGKGMRRSLFGASGGDLEYGEPSHGGRGASGAPAGVKHYLSDGHYLIEIPHGTPIPEGAEAIDVMGIVRDAPSQEVHIERLPTPESTTAYKKWAGGGGDPLAVGANLTVRFTNGERPGTRSFLESGVNPYYFALMLANSPRDPFRQAHHLSPLFKGGEGGDPLSIVMPMRLD
jgi:hypothetical protein